LSYEAMELPANPGWTMFAYTAEPGSATDERLKLLASWAATTASEIPTTASLDGCADNSPSAGTLTR
ncbi:MAG: hypothetical protein JWM13_2902, partial [Arthrobacter sp.]|nr:hypothetical protein [Arthrobacter sp.]